MDKSIYRKQAKEAFLFDTKVENLFISEYMVTAPGEFVTPKVLNPCESFNSFHILMKAT